MTMESKWSYCVLNLVLFITTSSFILGANAVVPTYCGSKDTFSVKVDNVVISPNPVVSGKPATFEISATSEDDFSGGVLSIEVFYYGMPVHTESHDLCSKTSCPVKQGSFILTNSQSLPGFTPPGSYKLRMKMMDTDNKLLTCINFNFNIVHGSMISEQERVDVQTGIKLILKLCLADGFDMFPTLLVTDGSCMIDRRMGIHGHPLEIQALFYSALRCAREILIIDDGSINLMRAVTSRLSALAFHIREYYWLDMRKLNEIYRYKTEEYSHDAVNKFNIYPDQIPSWLVDWMPDQGGFLIGNLQPAHMDFRFFSLGNLWAIATSLTTPEQAESILNLIQSKWDDLIGKMPMKICYPALEYEEWRIITGSDPKNTPWSYHNGGSWPTLLWQLTVACLKMGRPDLATRAVEIAEKRLSRDRWPEYYDTKSARFIGKQSRLYQTWSIAGYLVAKSLLANPELATILTCEEDLALMEGCSCPLSASPRRKCSRNSMRSHILV